MTAEAHAPEPRLPARTPAGIRAALEDQDRAHFEEDYRSALRRAAVEFDLTGVHEIIEHWWQLAVLRSDRQAHQRTLATAAALRAGDPVPSTPWDQVRADLGI